MNLIRIAGVVGIFLLMCQSVLATPIPGSPNELVNGTFDNGLDGWEYTPGDIVAAVVGNPAPAAQCNRSLEGWGLRLRQVVDDSKNPLWDPNLHIKMIDLQADIAILVKDGATGGVRFRLDYWDESYNEQDEPPVTTDPGAGYFVTDWVEYTSSQETWFTTVNPFNQVLLPIQPRWVSVEIEFLQPAGSFNLVDNIILTSKCVPEPGTLMLLASGLVGLGFVRSRRKL